MEDAGGREGSVPGWSQSLSWDYNELTQDSKLAARPMSTDTIAKMLLLSTPPELLVSPHRSYPNHYAAATTSPRAPQAQQYMVLPLQSYCSCWCGLATCCGDPKCLAARLGL
ncbi:hypothetical protein CRG98_044792 [Punica granatum]|uniref:Uncharacterized protein n=1 Tax=Punica granatum TaxID=22663 RepID=A0A2I0HU85_PUNGR|nr:hypothetical protein CRG98_044792 [Punica granatum]